MSNQINFSDAWEFYPCNINDKPHSVRFDTAVARLEESEKKQYPHTIELLIPYIESTENGFPAPSDKERMNRIEDGFYGGDYTVRHIGVITGGDCSRFVFCCDGTDEDMGHIIKTLMGENRDIKFRHRVFMNDHFGYYENMLAPSLYENNWIWNRNVCTNLEKSGEAFKEPRDVDFFCYFASTQHIQDVSDKLCGQGFRELDRGKTEHEEYSLHMVLECIPTFDSMNGITRGILDLLKETDGIFDGWGSPILKDKEI